MNTTIEALQELYITLGGGLADTYDDICDGETVGNYTVIPDIVKAIGKVAPKIVKGIKLSKNDGTVSPLFNNLMIQATIIPENAANKSVTWTSSDESVATVEDFTIYDEEGNIITVQGMVQGVANGTATITATTKDGGYTATCAITAIEF